MSEELKPCPFCGAHSDAVRAFPRTCIKDTSYDASHRAYPLVRCLGCGASQEGKNWTGIETAIAKWNTRPAPAVQVPEGWKLVPKFATAAMIYAGSQFRDHIPSLWNAMLSAAPAAPPAGWVKMGSCKNCVEPCNPGCAENGMFVPATAPAVARPDCGTCVNRGRINGLSQESFCEQCCWRDSWRKDHYTPAPTGNADGGA